MSYNYIIYKKTDAFEISSQMRLFLSLKLLLIKRLLNGNRACNGHTNHRVVARAYKTHHLNVSRNGRRTGKLSVGVHTAHSIGHTVGRGACRHIYLSLN